MKKVLRFLSVLCFASLFGYVVFGAVKPMLNGTPVTEIDILTGDTIIDNVSELNLLNALLYKTENGVINMDEHGFVSQFMHSNFGTYLTGAITSIPKEKQYIKDEVIATMTPILSNYTIDLSKTNNGECYEIKDFYKSGEKIIIKIEKIAS